MTKKDKETLIKNILLSNLEKKDKNILINLLYEKEFSLDTFLITLLKILEIGSDFFDLLN